MNDLEFEKESKKMTVMIPDSVPMTRADGVALENRLRSEMLEIKTALRLEMGEMKSELRQEMGEMKSELRQEMIQLESRLMRYIHDQGWKMMGFQVATTGLMLSAFKFLH
jgi:hypothetical protein